MAQLIFYLALASTFLRGYISYLLGATTIPTLISSTLPFFVAIISLLSLINEKTKTNRNINLIIFDFRYHIIYFIYILILFFINYDGLRSLIGFIVLIGPLFFLIPSSVRYSFVKSKKVLCLFIIIITGLLAVLSPSPLHSYDINLNPPLVSNFFGQYRNYGGVGSTLVYGVLLVYSSIYLLESQKFSVAMKIVLFLSLIYLSMSTFNRSTMALVTIVFFYFLVTLKSNIFLKFLLIFVFVLLFSVFMPEDLISRLNNIFEWGQGESSNYMRLNTYIVLLNSIQNYFFGDGLGLSGNFLQYFNIEPANYQVMVSESYYIKLLSETGLTGLTLFLLLAFHSLRISKNPVRSVVLIQLAFLQSFENVAILFVCWLLLINK
jgi:hypothetical protein